MHTAGSPSRSQRTGFASCCTRSLQSKCPPRKPVTASQHGNTTAINKRRGSIACTLADPGWNVCRPLGMADAECPLAPVAYYFHALNERKARSIPTHSVEILILASTHALAPYASTFVFVHREESWLSRQVSTVHDVPVAVEVCAPRSHPRSRPRSAQRHNSERKIRQDYSTVHGKIYQVVQQLSRNQCSRILETVGSLCALVDDARRTL